MIQAALGGLILLGIYKFMNSKSEYEIDWWIAAGFIFVPAIVVFLLTILFGLFEIDQTWFMAGIVLYFLFPYLFLKFSLDFQTGPAIKYSSIVPIVVILLDIAWVAIFGMPDA